MAVIDFSPNGTWSHTFAEPAIYVWAFLPMLFQGWVQSFEESRRTPRLVGGQGRRQPWAVRPQTANVSDGRVNVERATPPNIGGLRRKPTRPAHRPKTVPDLALTPATAHLSLPYTSVMSKLLRIALTWMLVVALPIQGYAAQAMLTCAPAHHQSAVVDDQAHHDHDTASEDMAVSMSSHGDIMGSPNASFDHHAKTFKAGHASKCSACSSCCSAAAITTSVLALKVIPQHAPVVATIPAGNAVEAIGGLDRPPRPLLA